MKGEIERIWKNKTGDGRFYNVLLIGGEKYSLWEEGYLDKLHEGQALEFDFSEAGDYKNICKIYEPAGTGKQAGKEEQPPETAGNGQNQRSRQIVRMSSLRSASQILGGSRIPAGERAGKTIEIAKKFEKYIGDDSIPGPGEDD